MESYIAIASINPVKEKPMRLDRPEAQGKVTVVVRAEGKASRSTTVYDTTPEEMIKEIEDLVKKNAKAVPAGKR